MLFYIFSLFAGLVVGSFLDVVIFRLRYGGQIWRGRSKCPRCHKILRWFELIPILSFIIQKGRCRSCQNKISWQYPIIEIVTAALFLIIFNFKFLILKQFSIFQFLNSTTIVFLFYCFIASVLLVIFVYDLKYGEIPDIITLPAIGLILIVKLIFGNWKLEIGNLSLAVLVGAGFFLFQYLISKGRWIGGGDIRLGALMGAILGWPNILVALLIAYVLGAIASLLLIALKKKKLADQTPFGTYLTAATFVAMVWGSEILEWYIGSLSF